MKTRYKLIKIAWLDSLGDNQPIWQLPEEVKQNFKKSQEHFISVGYLIYQDKKNTVLANSIHYADDGKQIGRIGGIFSVPTGAIFQTKILNN